MNSRTKILIFLVLFSSPAMICTSQTVSVSSDTIYKRTRTEESVSKKEGNQEQTRNQYQKNSDKAGTQNQGNRRPVKQIKSARPDMSKARGAKPPTIGRPSGSGIPKGIGKPGGAIKKVGR